MFTFLNYFCGKTLLYESQIIILSVVISLRGRIA